MKQKLQKAFELQSEVNQLLSELHPFLKEYMVKRHGAAHVYINDIQIKWNTISFVVDGQGWGDDQLTIHWNYFDNPDEYVRSELEQQAKEKAIREEKYRQERIVSLTHELNHLNKQNKQNS